MNLQEIVENFQPKRANLLTSPSLCNEKTIDKKYDSSAEPVDFKCIPTFQQYTPASSPEVEFQKASSPFIQCAKSEKIPVLSTIEVKGVVINHATKKFVCQVCHKEFIRKSGLVRHNLIHSGIKPNVCNVCGKRFLQKSALTVHYRTHSGEKPYSCERCGRRFSDSSSLCRHYRMHMAKGEGGKPSL